MHMIEAVIKPEAVAGVLKQLTSIGVLGCTAVECKGYGKQKGHTERYRGGRLDVGFVPKVMIHVAVREDDLDPAVQAIVESARSDGGSVGDGKLFVSKIEKTVRIRTGELNEDAL